MNTSLAAADAPFSTDYAAVYDALYADKNYSSECDLLERVFREHAARPVRGILDLGCGTGGHALMLAQRGYEVVGVDGSTAMIARAAAKSDRLFSLPVGSEPGHAGESSPRAPRAPSRGGPMGAAKTRGEHLAAPPMPPRWVSSPIETLSLPDRFDAAILMFAVIGYLADDERLDRLGEVLRRHLRPGGLVFLDGWYAPAVRAQRPGRRQKIVDSPIGRIARRSVGRILSDPPLICEVEFETIVEEEGKSTENGTRRFHETHLMRAFDESELAAFAARHGFDPRPLASFPGMDAPADPAAWSFAVVLRAPV